MPVGSLKITDTPLTGLVAVHTEPFRDERGAFYRCFCDEQLETLLGERIIKQINHSRTEQCGAIRGLHFQYPPWAEMKFVRCLRGRVWDVAIDLRRNSPTFLRWHAEELSADNFKMLVIPEGFAHGFQTLESSSELLYLHTNRYQQSSEGGLRFDDPRLAIAWPYPAAELSVRDSRHPLLTDQFNGL